MVVVDTPPDPLRAPFWLHDATITIRVIDLLHELGVFAELAAGPATTGDLAQRLDLAPRPLELALDVTAHHTGIVRSIEEGWALDDATALDMVPRADALRTILRGGPPTRDAARADESAQLYGGLVERIGRLADALHPSFVPMLHEPGQRVLELAAGASPWGRALCAADPSCHVTAVDLAPVLDTTRSVVGAAGFADRYDFVAGDVFTIDDLDPADLVVVAGFCRLMGPDQNAELFGRTAQWCRPGGRVAVIDAISTAETRADGLAGYELGLLTRTSVGRCWTLDRYAGWLTDAGFAHLEPTPTNRPEVTLVTARRTARS